MRLKLMRLATGERWWGRLHRTDKEIPAGRERLKTSVDKEIPAGRDREAEDVSNQRSISGKAGRWRTLVDKEIPAGID